MKNINSLCQNRDYKRIYIKGKNIVSKKYVLYVLKNRTNNIRFGMTTSKKIGNAVKRNRSRRIMREAFLSILPHLKNGYDIVLVARGRTPYLKSDDILIELKRNFKKLEILEE